MLFDSSDFVVAFRDGGYEMGFRPVAAVPELAAGFRACLVDDPTERLLHFLLFLHRLALTRAPRTLVSAGYRGAHAEHEYRDFARAIDHLRSHGHRRIPLAEMAGLLGMSVPTFTRFFRRMTGSSFVDYANRWRIEHACVLLRETDASILAVSQRAGFGNLSHFNRQFRRQRGCSPKEFRRRDD